MKRRWFYLFLSLFMYTCGGVQYAMPHYWLTPVMLVYDFIIGTSWLWRALGPL